MKTRFTKMLALLLTVIMLMTCMTGCQDLDYREAVQLYNARQYDKAIELFYELGDYENSKELFTASHYWAAMERMEDGDYGEALPRFLKLGDYEDAEQRVMECRYQMGIQAFEAEGYEEAEQYFLDTPDYRLTSEYLRQLNFQKLYDHIAKSESGILSAPAGAGTVSLQLSEDLPNAIVVTATWYKDMGYLFEDTLQLTISRDSTNATFTATSTFTMDFGDGQIGSRQTGSGTVDLSTYAVGRSLPLESFHMTGTDNLGNDLTSEDPAQSTMGPAITENMAVILQQIPIFLASAGAEAFF